MNTFIHNNKLKPLYLTYTQCYLCNIDITNQEVYMINDKPTCSKKCRNMFNKVINPKKTILCDYCFKRINEEGISYNDSLFCSKLCCKAFLKGNIF